MYICTTEFTKKATGEEALSEDAVIIDIGGTVEETWAPTGNNVIRDTGQDDPWQTVAYEMPVNL